VHKKLPRVMLDEPYKSIWSLLLHIILAFKRQITAFVENAKLPESSLVGGLILDVANRAASMHHSHSFSQGSVAQSGYDLLRSLYSSTLAHFDKRNPRNDFRWNRHVCAIARRQR